MERTGSRGIAAAGGEPEVDARFNSPVAESFRADNNFVDVLIETIKSDDSDTESFIESIHPEVMTICTESKTTAGWSAP